MLRRIVNFRQAEAYLAARQDRPTYAKAREYLTAWDAETRRRSFFSARVASIDVLSTLHRRCQDVVDGRMTDAQARELLRVYLEGDGAGALRQMGFLPQPEAPESVAELASVRRLQLILYQNAKIATEAGHYRQWAENRALFPYGRWHLGPAETHRDAHVARDGKVYAFDHPIWRTSPPGSEFNCRCWREELTAEEASGLRIEPNDRDLPSPTVDFDPGAPLDVAPPVKAKTPPGIVEAMRLQGYVRNDMPAADVRQRIDDAMIAVRRTFGVGLPDTRVEPMTAEEAAADPRRLGLSRFDQRSMTLRIALRPGIEFPGVTTVHEAIHGLFLSGRLTPQQEATILQAVQQTETWEIFRTRALAQYGDRADHEWVVRAMTWEALSQKPEGTLAEEAVAFYRREVYGSQRWSDSESGASAMRKAIQSVRPGFLRRMLNRIGLADATIERPCLPSPSEPGISDEERKAREIAIVMSIPDEQRRRDILACLKLWDELGHEPCGTF